MLPIALTIAAIPAAPPMEYFGSDVGLKLRSVVTGGRAEIVEELYARDSGGKFRLIVVSPTHPNVASKHPVPFASVLQGQGDGLFSAPPSFGFTAQTITNTPDGAHVVLTSPGEGHTLTKDIFIPARGRQLHMAVRADFTTPYPIARYLLNTYAFAPDGKRMADYGKPDATFAPAIRPGKANVIADHFFRGPAVVVQKGPLAASIMPDLDVLQDNRPIPTIVDLDCESGVVDAPLMSYGFCDAKLVGHVYFANDTSMAKPVPPELLLGMDVILNANAEPAGAYREAAAFEWERYGSKYFDKVLPQAMPFADYAKVCYPAAFAEKDGDNQLGWFEQDIDGSPCGGVFAGWGYDQGWVSWQPWFNNLRSAWGMHWWGKRLGIQDWVDKSNKMLNLALAAPMNHGAVPTTYMARQKTWRGCLIQPTKECYYDLTNMAWKGIWMLEWAKLPDCPRREDVMYQCQAMANLMVAKQNSDGSIPTWLDKDLKVIPVLDHSAQTALPAWFLAEMADLLRFNPTASGRGATMPHPTYAPSARRAADFLIKNVVDQQRWYDFETFFSCSPKQCLQRNGVIDADAMHDPHTLQAPQNTLCMHWAAEALRSVSHLTGDKKYMPYALKALDTMSFYQNVWPISYRKVAYTYGGFGVQNSDGEYNDARQAQFGASLCDFGAELGRKDYFERGVAGTRAALTLINHPLHIKFGIYPNPNYPLGLEPENDGHGGTDQQNGRTGFDWGEGSGLTSMAYLLEKYGSTYQGKGWSVLVDGAPEGWEPPATVAPPLKDPAFDFTDWRMPGWTIDGTFLHWPTRSRRFNFNAGGKPFIGTCEDGRGGYDDEYTGAMTSPVFTVSKPKMSLLVGGGAGKDVYVELIDSETGKQLAVAHGANSERMEEVTWDLTPYAGRKLQLRIVDKETGGWGHINVGNVRCGE